MRPNSPPFVSISLALGACAAAPADDDSTPDDDDSALSDDDTAVGDDDSTPDACTQPEGPYSVSVSGGQTATMVFTLSTCNPMGADTWSLSYTEPGGTILRMTTGPLVEGTVHTTDLSISFVQGNTFSYAGRTATGHVASLTVDAYPEGGVPCGSWTTDPLEDNTQAQGPAVILAPQPIPIRCP